VGHLVSCSGHLIASHPGCHPPPLVGTVRQVGDLYGLKGERVRQIEGVAMKMLKKGLQQGLRKTLDVQHAD
jgi:hypothetical protein